MAREINREIGQAYVARSTASEWLTISRIPRQPLPTVIANVLSQACRRKIAVPQHAAVGLTQCYFRTALQASHVSDDRELAAHVLGWMARYAAYRGRVTEAVEIAGAAVTGARAGRPMVQSLA
ncbi:MAG: hypothetical protein ACRD3Q_12145, partial [Terriglobales bacterium]